MIERHELSLEPGMLASFREMKETHEREYIAKKLEECDGNVTRTAEQLGIDRSHLYRRMKALGLSAR